MPTSRPVLTPGSPSHLPLVVGAPSALVESGVCYLPFVPVYHFTYNESTPEANWLRRLPNECWAEITYCGLDVVFHSPWSQRSQACKALEEIGTCFGLRQA